MKAADFSIRHPVVITICLVALIIFGLISGSTMSQEFFAQVEMPTLVVITRYPGAGAEEVEREVSSVIEKNVSTISGISTLRSTSYDSFSFIEIEFSYDVDTAQKIGDMREKINDAKNDLPQGADNPQILQFSTAILPVYSFSIESSLDPAVLDEYVNDTVIPRLSRLSGVAQCNLRGAGKDEVCITLRADDLAAAGTDVLTVFQLLQANNSALPAGQVRYQDQMLNVRINGQYASLGDIENLTVGVKNGVFIRLADIADVELKPQKYDLYVTQGDRQIQLIDVMKQQGADTVKLAAKVKTVLGELNRESNDLVRFVTINDDSYNINLAINSLRDSALMGAALAIFVIFLFLHNIRSTFIIGISIPCSILFAFCLMAIKGQGINLMTLMGLTVSVGMIVDNSIVVLENIYRQYMLLHDAKKAASIGTSEVAGSIIASTATTLVVFIPILFLKGLTGVILTDVALTIVWAIGSSMISALIVVPFLSAYLLKPVIYRTHSRRAVFVTWWDSIYIRLESIYEKLLNKSLSNRKFVLVFAIVLLILSLFSAGMLGFEFLTESDMNEVLLKVTFPPTYNLEDSRKRMIELDEYVRSLVPETETTAFFTGTDSAFGFLKQANKGYARVRLVPTEKRQRTIFDIINQLRLAIPERFSGIQLSVENGGLGQLLNIATGGGGLVIELYGSNLHDLYRAANDFARVLESDAAVDSVQTDINFDTRELVATIDQDATGTLGINSYSTALLGRILFSGAEAGTYRKEGKSFPITLKSSLADSTVKTSDFDSIMVSGGAGQLVPFSSISQLKIENVVNQVTKKNKMRTVTVQALLNSPDLRSIQNRVLPQLEKLDIPAGVNWEVAGSAASMKESFSSLTILLCISIFLVYMVMVIQFERFIQPLIVMVSIPFAFIGIVISLTLFNTTLSIVSMLGVITLVGTVVNTAIVLIDYVNLMRTGYGMNLTEALLTGCKNRLRPILMSVLTTVIGLVPMIFSIGEGSALTAPLARAIFGGLLSSTFVTLIFIPVLYYSVESKKEKKAAAQNAIAKEPAEK